MLNGIVYNVTKTFYLRLILILGSFYSSKNPEKCTQLFQILIIINKKTANHHIRIIWIEILISIWIYSTIFSIVTLAFSVTMLKIVEYIQIESSYFT